MASFFKRIGLGLLAIFVILYALGASYYLPRTELVHVTGTEIKRADREKPDGTVEATDVRYVMTQRVDDKTAMVFRNEDTGWGWPPYFKFDSGDLSGEATNLSKSGTDTVVLVRYYGWRTNLFSLFPNVVSLQEVEPDYESIPVFNIAFIVVSILMFIFLAIMVRRWSKWRPFKKKGATEAAAPADPEPSEPSETP